MKKSHSKSNISTKAPDDSPSFPSYLQPTQASLTKHSKSVPKNSKNISPGRSFIYKQELGGNLELKGKKKLLRKDESGGSLLSLLEKTSPYNPLKTKRSTSPNSSYRVFQPELNCDTPKFQGVRTYYKDFLNVDPITNNLIGRSNSGYLKGKDIDYLTKNQKKNIEDKENSIPCLPKPSKEKIQGKKVFTDFRGCSTSYLLKNYQNLIDNPSFEQKQPKKKKPSFEYNKSVVFEPPKQEFKTRGKPLKSIHILPEGPEKEEKKVKHKYPNQKRILYGDSAFWNDFKNKNPSMNFKKNDHKINNNEFGEYLNWIRKEKESLEQYLNKDETLDTSNGSIYREHRKKQFPHSPIFKTSIQFG